jgi:hypothetical protein
MALKSCRECGKDVSQKAAACPHCGVARPVPKEISKLSAVLFVFIMLGVAVFLFAPGPDGDAPTDAIVEAADTEHGATDPAVVTAVQMGAIYKRSEASGDARFKGHLLLVTGTVHEVEKSPDAVIVLLRTGDPRHPVRGYTAGPLVEGLSKDAEVTLACEGRGLLHGSPVLINCIPFN